ncbi:MAG: hypothetical protein ACYS0C_08380 [Planctomycetota bacterium]
MRNKHPLLASFIDETLHNEPVDKGSASVNIKTPTRRPPPARYDIRVTRYELCLLLE